MIGNDTTSDITINVLILVATIRLFRDESNIKPLLIVLILQHLRWIKY